jgi:hypothetical protein
MKSIPRNKQPNPLLLKAIKERKYPYGVSTILGPNGMQLAEKEYHRCIDFYNKFGGNNWKPSVMSMETQKLLQRIHQLELPHLDALQDLAETVVRKFLGAPEDVISLQCTIKENIIPNIVEERPVKVDQKKLQEHVQKRIILNATVHGAAGHIWKSLHFLVEPALNQINPELFGLYNKLIANSSVLMWMMPPLTKEQAKMAFEMPNLTQGQNQVEILDDELPTVTAVATTFPTMIHELTKGILDTVILHGIDQELTEDELEYVYQQADAPEDEHWYSLLGPGVWQIFVDNYVDNSQSIPQILQEMSVTSYSVIEEELNNAINDKSTDETPDETRN